VSRTSVSCCYVRALVSVIAPGSTKGTNNKALKIADVPISLVVDRLPAKHRREPERTAGKHQLPTAISCPQTVAGSSAGRKNKRVQKGQMDTLSGISNDGFP
jgi:hypothetical protein